MTELKARLFDPVMPGLAINEIADAERLLSDRRRMNGGALVADYRRWRDRNPEITAGMVQAARNLETAEIRALLRYLQEDASEAAA